MKALIVLLICLSVCIIGLTACKKEKVKTDDSDTSGIVLLRDKSATEIKSVIKGNWKIHYNYGGFTGNQKQALFNSYFKFLANDSVYVIFSDRIAAAGKAVLTRKKTVFGYTACCIGFSREAGFEWVVDYRHGDTLVLVDNSVEPYSYHMTKIP